MKTFALIIVSIILCSSCKHPLFSLNYRDKIGKRQGLWKDFYYDGSLHYKVRYRDNIPKGKMKYYYQNGAIQCIERYKRFSNDINTVYYHPNGAIDLKGLAELIIKTDTVLYQWKGQWQKFDSTGKLIEIITYRYGQIIGSKKN